MKSQIVCLSLPCSEKVTRRKQEEASMECPNAEKLSQAFLKKRQYSLAKDRYTATSYDNFSALSYAVRDRLVERWLATQQRYHDKNRKRVYYLSMEFLIGRLLGNNLVNLGIECEAKEALAMQGLDIAAILEEEEDAGLGNGGLGRLAACFLDSMATLGIPAHGYGIRYDYGIFAQKIINGHQVELPDEWLKNGFPWEFARPEHSVKIGFYGRTVMTQDPAERLNVRWIGTEDVIAVPYDVPVPGYRNGVVNTLRLWSARSSEEFDLDYFNHGDYTRAVYKKVLSENISKVLYPSDSASHGQELRLKQEYFFTAASIADIVRRFKHDNADIRTLPDKAAIHLNDTHPALAIPELMRILLDVEGLEWEESWDIVTRVFAYTNHTVMPEALEMWAIPMFERLLPRHAQIIYEINSRFLKEVAHRYPGDDGLLGRISIIEEGYPKKFRMSNLAIISSHSVNGVSKIHTRLLVSGIFKDFEKIFPERFSSKTNGITQRRWLRVSNEELSSLITEAIGDSWITDLNRLSELESFAKDRAFCEQWYQVKQGKKRMLAQWIFETFGAEADEKSLFDCHVKRIHEYKRQVLFCFFIVAHYLRLKESPEVYGRISRTSIFSGKAAPGYYIAKLIIKLIHTIAERVNTDPVTRDLLKVIFLENYGVSLAEKIVPSADLSEQISAAGTEASGTGCMKFMANGALTIGTPDGANLEIFEAVGEENMFLFGIDSTQAAELRAHGYHPSDYISRSELLSKTFRFMEYELFSPEEYELFSPILKSIREYDPFFICADFDAYCSAQDRVAALRLTREEWVQRSILNVARCGRFSSDRTVSEYARDIWGISDQDIGREE
ncbi:MAG: glycogen/starch/alpha-glucan phosphorylase [Candidatus Ratteibacteria bacterium]